jgi:glyoxylase-like metal-dependent hydrolase (beta-lactamase superfamily II)
VNRREAVLIDCGEDWLSRLTAPEPAAILLSHAHPDYAGG